MPISPMSTFCGGSFSSTLPDLAPIISVNGFDMSYPYGNENGLSVILAEEIILTFANW
jgi:hypothetical protein